MSWLSQLTNVLRASHVDRELDEEQRFHLETRIEQLVEQGLTREFAEAEAARRFGNQLLLREQSRDIKVLPGVESVWQDIRYAISSCRRTPAVAVTVVGTIAVGLAVNAALFTVFNAFLFRPEAVRDPGALYRFSWTQNGRQREINQILNLNAGQVPGLGDTWSRAFGICCDQLADDAPQVQARDFFHLNEATLSHDRPHNFQASFVAEIPFGKGKPFLNNGGALSAIAGGWQVNGLLSLYSGTPFTITSAATSLNLPGSNQRADQVTPEVRILGEIGLGPRRHR